MMVETEFKRQIYLLLKIFLCSLCVWLYYDLRKPDIDIYGLFVFLILFMLIWPKGLKKIKQEGQRIWFINHVPFVSTSIDMRSLEKVEVDDKYLYVKAGEFSNSYLISTLNKNELSRFVDNITNRSN